MAFVLLANCLIFDICQKSALKYVVLRSISDPNKDNVSHSDTMKGQIKYAPQLATSSPTRV